MKCWPKSGTWGWRARIWEQLVAASSARSWRAGTRCGVRHPLFRSPHRPRCPSCWCGRWIDLSQAALDRLPRTPPNCVMFRVLRSVGGCLSLLSARPALRSWRGSPALRTVIPSCTGSLISTARTLSPVPVSRRYCVAVERPCVRRLRYRWVRSRVGTRRRKWAATASAAAIAASLVSRRCSPENDRITLRKL